MAAAVVDNAQPDKTNFYESRPDGAAFSIAHHFEVNICALNWKIIPRLLEGQGASS